MKPENTIMKTTGAIELVSFDLDGTLVQYERSPGDVLTVAFEELGVDPLFTVEEYYRQYERLVGEYDSIGTLRQACFETLAVENGYERERGLAVAAAFDELRDQSRVELLPGVEELLSAFEDLYSLAIITNGARDAQHRKLDAVGLDDRIGTVVVAGADTKPKPDPEPFERVCSAVDTQPANAVHVGDSLETDVAGATAAGMESVWIADKEMNDHQGFTPTYRVPTPAALREPPWQE